MPPASRAKLRGGRGWGQAGTGRAGRGENQPDSAPNVEGRRPPPVDQLDQRVELIDLELARDVRSTEAELARGAKNVRHPAGRTNREDRAAVARRRDHRSVPEM